MTRQFDRRTFLGAGVAVAAGTGAAATIRAADQKPGNSPALLEPAREVPIVEHADVVVCGAGPAGISAAVAAARTGARTRLIEVGGCLGGIWTAGLLSWILDSRNKPGLMQELLGRLETRGAAIRYGGSVGYDVERMKLVLEEMAFEAGVELQLHTRVVAAAVNDAKRLNVAVTESKSGRQAWSGEVFIDATGDGDLAAQAGCHFDYGREGSGEAQPMSMIALLVGLDAEEVEPFTCAVGKDNPKACLLEQMHAAGVDPSYAQPTLFRLRGGLFAMMANHEYGVNGTDAASLTGATLRGRAEVHRLVEGLRSLGGPWKDVHVTATAEHIGVREGRRIRGLHQVTRDDLIAGTEFEDAVCRVTFPVDVHSTDPNKDKGIMREGVRAKPYDIPYRALIARDVAGLLMAGRNISGDFLAHSSYRVTGNSVATGEAAGTAAALAARSGRLPQDIPWPKIRGALKDVAAV